MKANKTSPFFLLELDCQLIKISFFQIYLFKGKTSQTAIKSVLHTTGTFKQILVSI